MNSRLFDTPVLGSIVVRGLIRLWVVGTIVWLVGALVLGLRGDGVLSLRLVGTALGLPIIILLGAFGTVWVVRGFQRTPRV